MKERLSYVSKPEKLSIRKQSELLSVCRSSLYYRPVGEKTENLALMRRIDALFLDDPTLGVLGMQDALRDEQLFYSVKRIRRFMRKMCLNTIYPKRNLSKLGKAKYVVPYLLRNLEINRTNQVWAIDITYVPMKRGFLYLTAIIDVYSRFIVGWQISNSLDKENQTMVLKDAIAKYGKPEIINSDQGSQYTSAHWLTTLKELGIQASMDGKGRATDNAFIERFFGTIKRKHIYLYPAQDGQALHHSVERFIKKYNNRRHQGIKRQKPSYLYLGMAA